MGDFSHQSLHRVYDLTLINTSQGLVLNPSQPHNLSLSLSHNNTKPLSLHQNNTLSLSQNNRNALSLPQNNTHLIHQTPSHLDHNPPPPPNQIHPPLLLSDNKGEATPPNILLKSAARDDFWKSLQSQYNCEQGSDCLFVCKDGVRLVATIVMAAASSLIRRILTSVRRDGIDEQMTMILPDVSVEDLDDVLLSLYGAVTSTKHLDTNNELFTMFGIDFNIGCNIAEEDVIPENDLVKLKELAVKWRSSKDEIFTSFISYLSAVFRGIGPHDLKRLNKSEKNKPTIRRRVVKFNKIQELRQGTPATKREVQEEHFLDNLLVAGTDNIDDNSDIESDTDTFDDPNTIFDDLDNFSNPKIRQKAGHFLNCSQDSAGLYCCSVPNCQYKSAIQASLFVHDRKTHVARKYKDLCHWCSQCGEWWSNKQLFEKHKSGDDCGNVTEWPFVCELCGRGWFNLRIYTDHVENALDDSSQCSGTPFDQAQERKSCDYCEERFYSSVNLTHHTKHVHGGKALLEPPVNKEWMDQKKTQNQEKKDNVKIDEIMDLVKKHDSEAVVFICKVCGIDYKTEGSLKRHEENKHNEGRVIKKEAALYYCSKCPKYFNTKGYLNQHNLFKHSDIRAFSCEQCGKQFKSKHCVNIHLRSHGIGGQMWTCEQCGKSFKQISSYHQHLHVHSDIREFACEICGKAFKMKSNLKKHLKLHVKNPNYAPTNNDAKVFSCDICGKKFKRADNLNAHKKKHISRAISATDAQVQFKIEGENGHGHVVKLESVLGLQHSHPQLRLADNHHHHHHQDHHRDEEMPLVLSHDPLALADQHHQVVCACDDMCQWTGSAAQYVQHKKMHQHAYSMGFRVPG